MSGQNKFTGKAPRQRTNLPRSLKRIDVKIRWSVYEQLRAMADGDESDVAIVERLIVSARPNQSLCR
jgi:hypothetical protein